MRASANSTDEFLEGNSLTKYFLGNYPQVRHGKFPSISGSDHAQVLRSVFRYLDENVHPHTSTGAATQEAGLYLTNHGPDHVRTVIERASTLLDCGNDEFKITVAEAFLLLLAICFHDTGNIAGRSEHAERALEEINKVPEMRFLGRFEKTMIANIAIAHGGGINPGADPLARVQDVGTFHTSGDVRPQCLAAILRFSDELADDWKRADQHNMQYDASTDHPIFVGDSALYHTYASCLQNVNIPSCHSRVSLHYMVDQHQLGKTFKKNKKDVYLLDEIYDRTLKTYKEAVYCSHSTSTIGLNIKMVDVVIEIYETRNSPLPKDEIKYTIGDIARFSYFGNDTHGTLADYCSKASELVSGELYANSLVSN